MQNEKLNILLADDDTDDCLFFKQALAELKLSAELDIVHDGEELMNYLAEKQDNLPAILFLDINMPRKNGAECLEEIRRNQKFLDIAVIMFSTSNSWDTINRLFKTGTNIYIHKPNDFSELKQIIFHAISLAGEKVFSAKPLKYLLNAANAK